VIGNRLYCLCKRVERVRDDKITLLRRRRSRIPTRIWPKERKKRDREGLETLLHRKKRRKNNRGRKRTNINVCTYLNRKDRELRVTLNIFYPAHGLCNYNIGTILYLLVASCGNVLFYTYK